LKRKILNFIYEGCEVGIWMGLISMTYQLFVIVKNGAFGIQSGWLDVILLLGLYVLWFFAWQWEPKSKRQINQKSEDKTIEQIVENESDISKESHVEEVSQTEEKEVKDEGVEKGHDSKECL